MLAMVIEGGRAMGRSPANVSDVITHAFLDALRSSGVIQASLFGSLVDGSARSDSDIDLLLRFERNVSLFDQLRLADQLSALSGRRVDLVTALHPAFAPYIEPTLVPLPL